MRVSQRLDYTLRVLVAVAQRPAGSTVPVGEVARRLGLPKRFLEQQMTALAKQGIVRCRRGAGGGCALARPAEKITVAEVVRAVQGEILDTPHTEASATAEAWQHAEAALAGELEAVSIKDLAERQSAIDEQRSLMYYI